MQPCVLNIHIIQRINKYILVVFAKMSSLFYTFFTVNYTKQTLSFQIISLHNSCHQF